MEAGLAISLNVARLLFAEVNVPLGMRICIAGFESYPKFTYSIAETTN